MLTVSCSWMMAGTSYNCYRTSSTIEIVPAEVQKGRLLDQSGGGVHVSAV